MKFKHTSIIKVTSLLIIFILNTYLTSFFPHKHVIGEIEVIHSHPFKKNKEGLPNHSHTKEQFYTIQDLTNIKLPTYISDCVKLQILNPAFTFINTCESFVLIDEKVIFIPNLRAPPSIS